MKYIIELKNIDKKFGNYHVVKNISLQIENNSIVGLIGRNGSGKTVLLKIISGLYRQDSGEVYINGKKRNITDPFPKNMGILIDTGFLPNITGIKNLIMLSKLQKNVSKQECFQLMQKVGLNPFDKKKYIKYSTGMKQRLKLAQSLLGNPDILILDEPFNGIDKESVLEFRSLLKQLHEEGKTIIITSHHHEDIEFLCNEVYEMEKGILTVMKS